MEKYSSPTEAQLAEFAFLDQVMIGPTALKCDRKAALANHHMLHLDGRPFIDQHAPISQSGNSRNSQ